MSKTRAIRWYLSLTAAGLVTSVVTAWILAVSVSLYATDSYQRGAAKLREDQGGAFLVVTRVERTGSLFVAADLWGPDDLAGESVVAESQFDPMSLAGTVGLSRAIPWDSQMGRWPEYGSRYVEARGWPFLCLWCEVFYEYDPATMPNSKPPLSVFRGGLGVPHIPMLRGIDGVTRSAVLPAFPLWFGLTLNTLIFALLWAAGLTTAQRYRRRRRIRAGLCPTCKYEMSGLEGAVCPECGS